MDPDHPAYSDDALDDYDDIDDVERCHHGVPFDEECEDCEIEDDHLDDEEDD